MRGAERGAATVLATALAGALMFVAVATVWLAGLVADHRTAQAAADLAALAGARAVQHGRPACAEAAAVAGDNGSSVVSCAVSGDDVRVVVDVRTRALLGVRPRVTARAHAGPVG